MYQIREYLDHGILGFIFVFQVFKAQTKGQMPIPFVQDSDQSIIPGFRKNVNQIIVGIIVVFLVVNQKKAI
mgnify:CR=1 FL=1